MRRTEVPASTLKKYAKSDQWHLNPTSHAIDNLEKLSFYLDSIQNDKFAWKWVIISLDMALYAFAICALEGRGAMKPKARSPITGKLIAFDEALRRCGDSNFMKKYTFSRTLVLTQDEAKAVEWIHSWRNRFQHYSPVYWTMTKSEFFKPSMHVLRVTRFLALESGNCILSSGQVRRVRSRLWRAEKKLCQLLRNVPRVAPFDEVL